MGLLEILGIKRHGAEAHNATGVTPGTYSAPMTLEINEAGHVTAAYDVWQESVTYGNNDLVVGSDSFLYKSQLAGNVGNDPSVDDGTNWKFLGHELLPRDGTRAMEADLDAGSHKVVNLDPPTQGTDAANKDYVDSVAAGLGGGVSSWKQPARVATVSALAANSRSGNVLTASSNGALAAIDEVSLSVNDRVLVKNEATGANNGLYFVSALGSAGAPWTLTRTTDADASAEVVTGIACLVQEGTVNASRQFILTTTGAITLNTTALVFAQFGSGSDVPAGTSSGNTLRWNGSNWAESSVLSNDGTNVAVSTTGGAPALKVQNSAGGVLWGLSTAALGSSSGAGLSLGTTLTPNGADQRLGAINFGSTGSGSLLNGGFISVFTAESWATNRGTYLDFSAVTPGTTVTKRVIRLHGYGDVFLQASGAELTTSATRGYPQLATCDGTPTGVPATTMAGNAPFIFDRASNRLYVYNSGWQNVTSGEEAGGKFSRGFVYITDTYTVLSTDRVIVCDAQNTYDVSLPAASEEEGREVVLKRTAESGQLGGVTIVPDGSDKIDTFTQVNLSSVSLSAGESFVLVSDGIDTWQRI